MARGVGGYGRYEDSPDHVGCPWARSSESPCVARDGALALSSAPRVVCVGCGNSVPFLFRDLADDWPPAGRVALYARPSSMNAAADLFRHVVFEATAPLARGGDGDRPEPAGPPPAAPRQD